MHRQPIANDPAWSETKSRAVYSNRLDGVLYEIPDPPCNECRARKRCEAQPLDQIATCQGFRSYEEDGQRQYKTNVNMRIDPCCTCDKDCPPKPRRCEEHLRYKKAEPVGGR